MKIGKNRLYINWIDYGKKKVANGGLLTKEEYVKSVPYWRFYIKVKLKDKQVITTHRSWYNYTYDELLKHIQNMQDLKDFYPNSWPYVIAYPRYYENKNRR